jgi:hypothetical protein
MMQTKIYVERQPWQNGVSLHLVQQAGEGTRYAIAQPVTMETITEDNFAGQHHAPFLSLTMHAAQLLMDELWHCGLRPTEGTGSAGSLAATERHLDDMRKIALKGLYEPTKRTGR